MRTSYRLTRWWMWIFTVGFAALLVAPSARVIDAAQHSDTLNIELRGLADTATISGTLVVEAVVSSDQVERVQFQLDGAVPLRHTERITPYVLMGDTDGIPNRWDTTRHPDGAYTLNVTAFDRKGRTGQRVVRVVIANQAIPPPQPEATPLPAPDDSVVDAVQAVSAEQWTMFEMMLTAQRTYAAAYTAVSVTATFRGPAGEHQVAGFWDGERTWRVRFTPPVAGSWTYWIDSNQGDTGLRRSGTLDVRPAPPERRGFLRRDPAHPTGFRFDNGERFLMMGQTYYEIVRAARAGNDWQSAVANSRQYGMNKIRMLVQPWGGTAESSLSYHPDAFPFAGSNHDQLDLAYWQALDRVVQYLDIHGMIADLILFTDAETAFGTQAQDERFVRYVLARYAAFPHVIWCLSNEWEYTGKNKGYWDRIGAIVRAEDRWMAQGDALRPLSIHNKTGGASGGTFSFFDSTWPTYAIIQWGIRNKRYTYGDGWGNASILQNTGHGMPVANDEYGYIDPATLSRTNHRGALWGIGVAGGYGSAGDARTFSDGPGGAPGDPYRTATWHDAPEYQDILHYVNFWTTRGIRYWEMSAQNDLVRYGTRVYVLGASKREYVVYAAVGGAFKVAIPSGRTYRVTGYNPREGRSFDMGTISGPAKWNMPAGEDVVLHIKAAG